MLNKYKTAGWLVAALTTLGSACNPPAPDESDYITLLFEDRALKDEFYGSDPESPVPLDRRSWMVPLRYYELDLTYRVPAQLNLAEDQPIFDIPTSTGLTRPYQRVGRLEFMLNGETRTLAALVELPAQTFDRLFVPFRDETSGTETYSAGRYLDLYRSQTGVYNLDFNRAYHPDCYFNEEYDCPFPPPENRLRTAVRAGEMLPPENERRIPLTNDVELPPESSKP